MSGAILGIIAGIAVAALGVWIAVRQGSKFKSVIAIFMEAGAAKNLEAAYACCSPQSLTKEEIAELVKSSYDVFAGYERVTIRASQSADGEAYASGAIIYTGSRRQPLKASLVKENGVWKITAIKIGSTAKGRLTRPALDG